MLVTVGKTEHGIEVKTLLDNGNDKITMHPSSRRRKEAWARKRGRRIHTVITDDRDTFEGGTHAQQYSGHRMYYRRGVGAFRLKGMTPVRDAKHLLELMQARAKR